MPEDPPADTPAKDDGAPIVCTTTPWYSKRMGLMTLMVFAFGCWFLYDALVGYPKKVGETKEYAAIVELEEKYAELKKEENLAAYAEFAAERGAGPEEPPTWRSIAAERGVALDFKETDEGDITEQKYWAGGAFLVASIIAVFFLINRSKKISADANSFTTPGGTTIPFESVYRIDKRKWKYKGLAYAHYTDSAGKKQKAALDDLKYGGTDKILDRLMANFSGELIDRVEDEDETPAEEAEKAGA
ncbi:hypothetical protein OAF27_01425 [Verrucomicrobiales bacterium]|nr:hypothetical protein [Verrucomicrobiales bacterium]